MAFFDLKTIDKYEINISILIQYTIHISIIITLIYIFTKGKIQVNKEKIFSIKQMERILKRIRLSLFVVLIIVIFTSAIPIFIYASDRGHIRANLGLFGPIYTFFSEYLLVFAVMFTAFLYFHTENKEKIKKLVVHISIIAFFSSLLTGYKATVVTHFLIPATTFLFYNKKIMKFIPYAFASLLFLIISTMMIRNIGINDAWDFLKYRIFYLTNLGTLGVYYELGTVADSTEFKFQFFSIFGKQITSFILGIPKNDILFSKMDLANYISYLIYPDKEGVLAGQVNLTVANFGEAVFFFGKKFYFLFSILTGIIIGGVMRGIKRNINKGYFEKSLFLGLYLFSVIIPWINSGGIFGLISLPTITYFICTYVYFKFLTIKFVSKNVDLTSFKKE